MEHILKDIVVHRWSMKILTVRTAAMYSTKFDLLRNNSSIQIKAIIHHTVIKINWADPWATVLCGLRYFYSDERGTQFIETRCCGRWQKRFLPYITPYNVAASVKRKTNLSWRAPGKVMRWSMAEDVTHMRAREDFNSPTTLPYLKKIMEHKAMYSAHSTHITGRLHPRDSCRKARGVLDIERAYPKWELQIFSTPDVHSMVVSAEFFEILAVYAEQSASHCRRAAKLRLSTGFLSLVSTSSLSSIKAVHIRYRRARIKQPFLAHFGRHCVPSKSSASFVEVQEGGSWGENERTWTEDSSWSLHGILRGPFDTRRCGHWWRRWWGRRLPS